MTRCERKVDIGRRWFLSGAGAAAAGAASAAVMPREAQAAVPPVGANASYPSSRLAKLSDLKPDEPLQVAYPDDDAPGVLIKLGTRVPGGVGPDGDVVGFSTVCPHKGYPLNYRDDDKTLNCPGHYSVFDCEKGGQQTWGHATQNLPQYKLRVDGSGDVFAEGLDELLYGRLSNVLGG